MTHTGGSQLGVSPRTCGATLVRELGINSRGLLAKRRVNGAAHHDFLEGRDLMRIDDVAMHSLWGVQRTTV